PQSVNSRIQIEDFEADLSSDYSYGNDADIQSSHFKNQNDDSKTAAAVSPDTRKDNSFEDDTGIQSKKYRLQNDNSKAATAISSELDSDIQHVDSKTTAVSPNLRGNSSFDDNAEIQPVNLTTKNEDSETADVLSVESSSQDDTKVQSFHSNIQNDDIETANASPYSRRESSSQDDTETRPVNSTKHTEDFKSEVHMDLVSGYMEDANKDKPNNSLHPIDKD
nr:hypothetical protein [Tanacetum cinerariifolium]